jgi:hypothetical protein
MKRFAIAIAALVVAFSAQPAKALTTDLGLVGSSTPTTFSYSPVPAMQMFDYQLIGYLPAYTTITFTYSLASATSTAGLVGGGSIDSLGTLVNKYNVAATAYNGANVLIENESDDKLIYVSAIMPALNIGKSVITNLSAMAISFKSALHAFLFGPASLTGTIEVSQVPLPAALPLFGLGIASLVGLRMRKKKAA